MLERLKRWLTLHSVTACGPLLKLGQMPYDFQEPPPDQRCENCAYFIDYRETEGDDWANGYCGHPWHFDSKKSEHSDYGGHWTNHAEWCGWWKCSDPASDASEKGRE